MIEVNLVKRDLRLGDCLEQLRLMPDDSVDSIVTDPPYGISFMGKKWDYDVPSKEVFSEMLRVLKPGGHALVACGTRTQHRMAVNIEDAGFEIRDVITWLYGSGFPKSMDISKAIDKQAGAEREVIATVKKTPGAHSENMQEGWQRPWAKDHPKTMDITDAAKEWQGWGTALKPACEFWTLARKPLSEKTVASNVLKHGTGGINIDGCRVSIDAADDIHAKNPHTKNKGKNGGWCTSGSEGSGYTVPQGRWPANLILDKEAAKVLDEQSGERKSGGTGGGGKTFHGATYSKPESVRGPSTGGASRFFYVAKASKSERNQGLEHLPLVKSGVIGTGEGGGPMLTGSGNERNNLNQNFHPTVKPVKLMAYLCRLITPPGGVIFDPYMGSGSTGVAAIKEGFSFIGIEREPTYYEICQARIK